MKKIYSEEDLNQVLKEIGQDLDDVWNTRDYSDMEKRRLSKNFKQKRKYYLKIFRGLNI